MNIAQAFPIASSNCFQTTFILSFHLRKMYSFRSRCTSKSTDLLKEKYSWEFFISIWQWHFNFNNRSPEKVWHEWLKNRYIGYLLLCNKLLQNLGETTNIFSYTVSDIQKLRSSCFWWFWLWFSHEIAVKLLAGAQSENLTGTGDLLPRLLTGQ